MYCGNQELRYVYGSIPALKALGRRLFAVFIVDCSLSFAFLFPGELVLSQWLANSRNSDNTNARHCRWPSDQGNHSEQNGSSASKLALLRWYLWGNQFPRNCFYNLPWSCTPCFLVQTGHLLLIPMVDWYFVWYQSLFLVTALILATGYRGCDQLFWIGVHVQPKYGFQGALRKHDSVLRCVKHTNSFQAFRKLKGTTICYPRNIIPLRTDNSTLKLK